MGTMIGASVATADDLADRGRAAGRWRPLTALLVVLAACHALLVGMTQVERRRLADVDPALVSAPGLAATQRAGLTIVLVVFTVVAIIGAVRWFANRRADLEILVGASVGSRPGPPRRTSPRYWRPLVTPVAHDRQAYWAAARMGSSRPLAVLTVGAVIAALVLWPAGLVLAWLAPDGATARSGMTLAVNGSVVSAVAAVLVAVFVQSVRRRAITATLNVSREIVLPPPSLLPIPLVLGMAALLFAGLGAQPRVDAIVCDVQGFECIDLVVPVVRGSADPTGESMTVRFAVRRGAVANPRVLVFAVGGPGASGLAEAPLRIEGFDRDLLRAFDVVFFDQRGVGASGGTDCELSAAVLALGEPTDREVAQRFVRQCLIEAGVPAGQLDRYATREVVGDLEALRIRLGVERLTFYGESYGTELVQAYAIAHPDRVEALVLDAPVDLALSAHEFWRLAADGFRETLEDTLADCDRDEVCAANLFDASATYGRLVDRLRRGPLDVDYIDPQGEKISEQVTLAKLESAVASLLYTEAGRMVVLRVLAEYERGDLTALGRLSGSLGTLVPDPAFSDFVYFAVTCADVRFSPTADDADVDAYLARAAEAGISEIDLGSTYYAGLPCLYWPSQPDPGSTPSTGLVDAPFPVLILTSTADPITRDSSAREIAKRLPDAHVIETEGGSHVTFGYGVECPDDDVVAFLVRGTAPRQRVTRCDGYVTNAFIDLTALDSGEYVDALDAMSALDHELFGAPEVYLWSGGDRLEFGCRFGGTVAIEFVAFLNRITLDDCEFGRGLPVDGSGTLNFVSGEVVIRATVPDGELTYRYDADGRITVNGTWEGKRVDLEG